MKAFIENVLRQSIVLTEYTETDRFPLYYRGNYHLFQLEIGKVIFLLAEPQSNLNLAEIRRQHRQLEKMTGLSCALYLKQLNYYAKDRMLDEGIPFIWEDKQVYLPFLGVLLQEGTERVLRPCEQISFLTQKLLLIAIYEGWKEVNVTQAAKRLEVTKTSITRCYDELEVLEIPYLKKKSRTRLFSSLGSKKDMWNTLQPYLRSPLIYSYKLEKDIEQIELLSGISALCCYTLLEDNEYPTYAVTKKDLQELELDKKNRVPGGERPGCVVQELGYSIEFGDGKAVDPLTVLMLLTEEEKKEPRVEKAIHKMLEDFVW